MTYYGKHVEEISLPEAALLAGLTSSPSRHSPVSHFEKAKERQVYVLERMLEEEYITPDEQRNALNEILILRKRRTSTGPWLLILPSIFAGIYRKNTAMMSFIMTASRYSPNST